MMLTMKVTLQLPKQVGHWEFPLRLFDTGIKTIRSQLSELRPEDACIVEKSWALWVVVKNLLIQREKSFMLECLPKDRKMTLVDKLSTSDPASQLIKWLKILALGLIGDVKDCASFLTKRIKDESAKWWLPTETGLLASLLTLLNTSLLIKESTSWFSTQTFTNPLKKNSQTTLCPSSTSTLVDTWGPEGMRTRKIRLYPSKKQSKIFKEWVANTRYTYNCALGAYKQGEIRLNKFEMRNYFVTADHPNREPLPDWLLKTPKDIRAGGIFDLINAHTTAFANLKKNNISKFDMGFRTKRTNMSITIPKSAISLSKFSLKMYPKYIPNKVRTCRDKSLLSLTIESDCRLGLSHGKWTLFVPFKKKEVKSTGAGICALDPGITTFQTLYSDSRAVKYQQDSKRLKLLTSLRDKLQSYRDIRKINNASYKRRECRINTKLSNLVDDMHFKVINDITKEHDTVLLPSFETSQMVSNKKKGLFGKSKRCLLNLKHFEFKERFREKAKARCINLKIVSEAFTSKTCTGCGSLKAKMNLDMRTYKCDGCHLSIDRDINGARNILLKNL